MSLAVKPDNSCPKGYKQTEVGVIPEDWAVVYLGALATMVASGRSSAARAKGNFPIHGSTGIIGYTENPEYEGDAILAARVGANAGKLNFVSGKYGVTDNTIILRLSDKCCLPFFWRQLEAKRLNSLVFGSGQPLITGTQLKALLLAVPLLPEQHTIAEALSGVDALLGALDRLIAKKRDLKQAAMQQLLTGQTRLPGFHGKWVVKRLGEIGQFRNGINKAKEDFGHGYPFANLMDVFGVAKVSTTTSFGLVNSTTAERELYELRKGDVLFVRSSVKPSGVGLTILIQENLPKAVFSGFLLRFRDEGMLTNEYKEHCFGEAGFRERLIASSTVSANTNINQVSLRRLTLRYPSEKSEQTAIAAVLSDMDAELVALEARREKTRALKQAMMQELLTGRTRLT
jgi:type I restriction enzyme, S subunit